MPKPAHFSPTTARPRLRREVVDSPYLSVVILIKSARRETNPGVSGFPCIVFCPFAAAARCNLPRVLSSSCLHGLLQCISLRCALGQAANAGDHCRSQPAAVGHRLLHEPLQATSHERERGLHACCGLLSGHGCPARVMLFNKLTTHFFAQSW